MKNIDHIGIAVKDIEKSILLFEKLLNTACYKIEEVKAQGVKTSFFKNGDQKIELIASLGDEIPKKGADNKMVVFLHPKTTNGVLIELCQEIK